MIIEGEKYACEACVRGHRVSACQHKDRALQHINKKGRPVSQCGHCRMMRKSRSSHVKCDCGEKTHKCKHLQTTVEGHTDSCCCNHGGNCTCCHKKEQPPLNTVVESDSDVDNPKQSDPCSSKKRCPKRTNTILSETKLEFDEHGHHKPMHKTAKPWHKSAPYSRKRDRAALKSQIGNGIGNRSVDSLLQDSAVNDFPNFDAQYPEETHNSNAHYSDSAANEGPNYDGRKTKSEAASPFMRPADAYVDFTATGTLAPLEIPSLYDYQPCRTHGGADLFTGDDQPMSAALSAPASVDWNHYEGLSHEALGMSAFERPADFAPSNYSHPQSTQEFPSDMPTLTATTSNSGEYSETEDSGVPLFSSGIGGFNMMSGMTDGMFGADFTLGQLPDEFTGNSELSEFKFEALKYFPMDEANMYQPMAPSLTAEEESSALDAVMLDGAGNLTANALVDASVVLGPNGGFEDDPNSWILSNAVDPLDSSMLAWDAQ